MSPESGDTAFGKAWTDSDLLEKIKVEDPAAFDLFVDRFGDRIFGFGLRMCGEREDARDVLQDTLLKAFTSLKDLRHPEAMKSWVYRVAANACLMKRRRGKFEPARELSLQELMPRDQTAEVEIPDISSMPDDDAARAELLELVRGAVEALPAAYRIVLVMRDMEQLSTREVARALDIPKTAVKMRLHRARLKVRQALEAGLGGARTPVARG